MAAQPLDAPPAERHLAIDDQGVVLRATWHGERSLVNLSLWRGDRCTETFHLSPVEAGRLIGFLAEALTGAVPTPSAPSLVLAPDPVPTGRRRSLAGAVAEGRRRLGGALAAAARAVRP